MVEFLLQVAYVEKPNLDIAHMCLISLDLLIEYMLTMLSKYFKNCVISKTVHND